MSAAAGDDTPTAATLRRGGSTSRPPEPPQRDRSDRTQLLLEVGRGQVELTGRIDALERELQNARDDLLREMGEARAETRDNRVEIRTLAAAQAQLTVTVERSVAVSTEVLALEQARREEEREDRRRREAREEEESREARAAAAVAAERRAQWWVRLWEVAKGPLTLVMGAGAGVVVMLVQRGC